MQNSITIFLILQLLSSSLQRNWDSFCFLHPHTVLSFAYCLEWGFFLFGICILAKAFSLPHYLSFFLSLTLPPLLFLSLSSPTPICHHTDLPNTQQDSSLSKINLCLSPKSVPGIGQFRAHSWAELSKNLSQLWLKEKCVCVPTPPHLQRGFLPSL